MRVTMPASWVRYFDARFHPQIVSLSDLYARGWSQDLVRRHLGFTPNVKGIIHSEEFPDVKSTRDAFLAEQERARPGQTKLALAMIEQAEEKFQPIDVSADEAAERAYGFHVKRLKEEKPDRDDLLSLEDWLKQGEATDGWHWPAYWIGQSIDDRADDFHHLTESEGAIYARRCVLMLDAIDRARRFAAIPGVTKWYWCEWTRLWKETRPAHCDPRWGDDDILPAFDRDVVGWPRWPLDLKVTPPGHPD